MYKLDKRLKKRLDFFDYLKMAIKSILLGLIIGIFVIIGIAYLIGYRPIVIGGGSMLPTLTWGDIIIVYKPAKEDIKVGDILTFYFEGENSDGIRLVTHRIIEIDENGHFYTQGDNPNNSPDGYPIYYSAEEGNPYVYGVTQFSLHYVGQFVAWIKQIPNLISIIASIWLLYEMKELFKNFFEDNFDML